MKLLWRHSTWPCYNGLLTIRGRYLYSARAGQIWRAEMPAEFPPHVYGTPPVTPIWRYSETDGYSELPVRGQRGYWPDRDCHPSTLGPAGFHFTLEGGKLHVRCGDKSARLVWERSSVTEMKMMELFI
jgi:hypothetical protein